MPGGALQAALHPQCVSGALRAGATLQRVWQQGIEHCSNAPAHDCASAPGTARSHLGAGHEIYALKICAAAQYARVAHDGRAQGDDHICSYRAPGTSRQRGVASVDFYMACMCSTCGDSVPVISCPARFPGWSFSRCSSRHDNAKPPRHTPERRTTCTCGV